MRDDHTPDKSRYLSAWAASHGGHDPRTGGVLERGWFAGVHRVAVPLRAVPPDLLTAGGVAAALGAAVCAGFGPRWCLLAAVLVALSAVLDGVDGAVAILAGRTSAWGHLLDSVCDRITEAFMGVALYRAGAPWQLVAFAVATGWLQEYARARAGAGGVTEILVVTVAERPVRVLAAMLGLLLAGILGFGTVGELDAETAVGLAAAGWVGLGSAGLAQIAVALRRALRGTSSA